MTIFADDSRLYHIREFSANYIFKFSLLIIKARTPSSCITVNHRLGAGRTFF